MSGSGYLGLGHGNFFDDLDSALDSSVGLQILFPEPLREKYRSIKFENSRIKRLKPS